MVTLRNYLDLDLNILLEIRNDIALQKQLMAKPSVNSVNDVKLWIEKRYDEKDTLFLIIADNASNQCVGFLQVVNIDKINNSGELGIGIHQKYQNKGYGKKAISLLIKKLQTNKIIDKIIINVLEKNKKAIRLYKNLNFTVCDLQRNLFLQDNIELNTIIMKYIINEK